MIDNKQLAEKSILVHLKYYRIKNEMGQELNYSSHYFLVDMLQDMSPYQVWLKAAQLGLSTLEIIKTLFCCKTRGWDIIYCVDKETECLTKKGFKYYNKLSLEDEILTFDLNNGNSQWTKLEEIFIKNVDMDLISFEGRNISALTTDNHRWITYGKSKKIKYKFRKTKDLIRHDEYIPKNVKNFNYPKKTLSDNYIKFVAWILTEGHYVRKIKNRRTEKDGDGINSICITQSYKVNKNKCDEIEKIFDNLNVQYRRYLSSNNCYCYRFIGEYSKKIRKDFPDKILTLSFVYKLSKEDLLLFIDTMIAGDGWIEKHNKGITKNFIQKNKECIENFNIACILAGYNTKLSKRKTDSCYALKLTQFNKVYTNQLKPKKIKYNNDIWCPRTKYGTFLARRNGYIYWTGNTLPTSDFAAEFVSSKVNRIIQMNSIYQEWTKDKDSVEQKQIGKNMIYYRGAQISKQAISVSADLVVNDEVDRSDQGVINQYETRLQHSQYQGKWLFSNPSLEGNGVSRYWKDSDQKHWFIKCSHCGKEQYMDWPESFDMDKGIYICKSCKGEIYDEDRRNGRWVAKYKNRKWSGYWIPLFIAPWVSAKTIIEKEQTMSRDVFYNFVLGKPYTDNNATITPDLIYRNLVSHVDRKQPLIIGCDSGILKHWVKGNVNGLWEYGSTERWEDIDKMLLENPGSIAFIDAMPDITGPRALKDKYEGRVFLCTFGGDRDKMELFDYKKGADFGNVRIERNRAIQNLVGEMVDSRISFEGDDRYWKDYVSHWLTMYRSIEKNSSDQEKMIWKSTNGKDHYCLIGDSNIITSKGIKKIKDIKIDNEVLTRKGYNRVIDWTLTERNTEIYEMVLSNGVTIFCTEKHPIFIKNKGFVACIDTQRCDTVEDINNNNFIWTISKHQKEKDISLMELDTEDILTQKEEAIEYISQQVGVLKTIGDCMKLFGLFIMERLRMVLLFIIKIIILLITQLKILKQKNCQNIEANTCKKKCKIKNIGINFFYHLRKLYNRLYLWQTEKKKGYVLYVANLLLLIQITQKLAQKNVEIKEMEMQTNEEKYKKDIMINLKKFVLTVIRNILHKELYQNIVVKDVKVVFVGNTGIKQDVYNIAVDKYPEYYAEGILVHNCFSTLLWRAGVNKFKTNDIQVFTDINPYTEFIPNLQQGEEGVIMEGQ